MSEWWWIVLAALAIIVAMEFVIMRSRDAGSTGGSVIDATGDYPGERETDRWDAMGDENRARATTDLVRKRNRQEPEHSPGGD